MHGFEMRDGVALVQFDEGKANAVGHGLIDVVEEALAASKADGKAVVLAGRAGLFSAGFDLQELGKGAEASAALVGRGARMLHALFTHPQPVVAACTGHAIAAGAFMLLSSDTRIGAAGSFKLGLNETAIGMSLPVFGLELAKARLSPRHLTLAVTQAHIYDPEGALAAGFLDELVDEDVVLDRALAEASRLGDLPAAPYAHNKMGVRQEYADTIAASLA